MDFFWGKLSVYLDCSIFLVFRRGQRWGVFSIKTAPIWVPPSQFVNQRYITTRKTLKTLCLSMAPPPPLYTPAYLWVCVCECVCVCVCESVCVEHSGKEIIQLKVFTLENLRSWNSKIFTTVAWWLIISHVVRDQFGEVKSRVNIYACFLKIFRYFHDPVKNAGFVGAG